MRTYLLVEVEKVPGSNRNLLTTFHGLFDSMDAAKQGLRIAAEALMVDREQSPVTLA